MLGSGWRQQAPPPVQPQPASVEAPTATVPSIISGDSTNTQVPTTAVNPFVSTNPFASSSSSGSTGPNPFTTANSNPFASSGIVVSTGPSTGVVGGSGGRSGRTSGFGDASSVSRVHSS